MHSVSSCAASLLVQKSGQNTSLHELTIQQKYVTMWIAILMFSLICRYSSHCGTNGREQEHSGQLLQDMS